MKNIKKKVIVILGTTASGKTKLAVNIAKKFNGEIISADSRQVYKGMDIGTGKDLGEYNFQFPISNFQKSVPYHSIDIISPKKQFTVADFQKLAYMKIGDILLRGKLPIICGGTGLYIDAVIKGFAFNRIKNQELRIKNIRLKLNKLTLNRLLSRLKKIDFATYKIIDKNNRRRVQRALEIYYETGIPKSKQQAVSAPPYEFLKIGITFPKDVLAKRIEKRLKQRLDVGMISEVKKLHNQGISWKKLDGFGLEYRWVSRYLRGIISKNEMEKELLKEIIHFAKRQMTWFKRDAEIRWVKNFSQTLILTKEFLRNSA